MHTQKTATGKGWRLALGSLLMVVALNAFGGGMYGMAGAKQVPEAWLKGTVFASYFFPGLILFICVGGSALFASVAVFRNWKYAHIAAVLCAAILATWIVVQVALIGYVSWLQPVMAVISIIIFIFTWILHMKNDR